MNQYIKALTQYGMERGLVENEDRTYVINQLLAILELDEYVDEPLTDEVKVMSLTQILDTMTDYACDNGIVKENSIVYRDLFDTKLMDAIMPRPSEVIRTFRVKYEDSPKEAVDYYYQLSQDSNYIRRSRIAKDQKWTSASEYGNLDITINLSKPEKDPKAIAAAKLLKQSGYPKCLLCVENEGYAGRVNHPARQNHRIIPVTIAGEPWGLQYSPYVYYNEHCILLNQKHVPMQINRDAFIRLFDFVRQFPHYFIGSNADLPIVGGSILTHEHFQGGNYEFPMAKAEIETFVTIKGFEDVTAGIVKWPMSVIRIQSKQIERLVDLADYILTTWRGYTDEACFIYARTEDELHNTITPIARKRGDVYEMDLVLRNNITTKEYPFGVYHPHEELHHIKKENIGLIEVMGLAVLPARLKTELEEVKAAILAGESLRTKENIASHAAWVEEFIPQYKSINEENVDEILQAEVGKVFLHVLEHAGVYKRDDKGRTGFLRFIDTLNK